MSFRSFTEQMILYRFMERNHCHLVLVVSGVVGEKVKPQYVIRRPITALFTTIGGAVLKNVFLSTRAITCRAKHQMNYSCSKIPFVDHLT